MHMMKRTGPRTDPWGIPLITLAHLEAVLFTHKACFLLLRDPVTHDITLPVMP